MLSGSLLTNPVYRSGWNHKLNACSSREDFFELGIFIILTLIFHYL